MTYYFIFQVLAKKIVYIFKRILCGLILRAFKYILDYTVHRRKFRTMAKVESKTTQPIEFLQESQILPNIKKLHISEILQTAAEDLQRPRITTKNGLPPSETLQTPQILPGLENLQISDTVQTKEGREVSDISTTVVDLSLRAIVARTVNKKSEILIPGTDWMRTHEILPSSDIVKTTVMLPTTDPSKIVEQEVLSVTTRQLPVFRPYQFQDPNLATLNPALQGTSPAFKIALEICDETLWEDDLEDVFDVAPDPAPRPWHAHIQTAIRAHVVKRITVVLFECRRRPHDVLSLVDEAKGTECEAYLTADSRGDYWENVKKKIDTIIALREWRTWKQNLRTVREIIQKHQEKKANADWAKALSIQENIQNHQEASQQDRQLESQNEIQQECQESQQEIRDNNENNHQVRTRQYSR